MKYHPLWRLHDDNKHAHTYIHTYMHAPHMLACTCIHMHVHQEVFLVDYGPIEWVVRPVRRWSEDWLLSSHSVAGRGDDLGALPN